MREQERILKTQIFPYFDESLRKGIQKYSSKNMIILEQLRLAQSFK